MAIDFDIQATLNQMVGVAKDTVGENSKDVKDILQKFAESKKMRLELLAKMTLAGEITKDELLLQLENEKLILEAQFNACAAISKAVAQKAINGAIDVLTGAILKAVKL